MNSINSVQYHNLLNNDPFFIFFTFFLFDALQLLSSIFMALRSPIIIIENNEKAIHE